VIGFPASAFFFAPPYDNLAVRIRIDVVASIVFVVVGAAVGVIVDELSRLADEHAALRRVASLVAGGAAPERVFAAVTEEVAGLLPVDFTVLNRYELGGSVTVVAGWQRSGGIVPVGTRLVLEDTTLSRLVSERGRPAKLDSLVDTPGPLAAAAREAGCRSGVASPIIVDGRLWGVMIAACRRRPPRDIETHLADFTELVATAIANAESRAELAASRARVVAAADESRRRIERDLHDGTQQRLVSLGLELRATEASVPPELTEVKEQLARFALGLSTVVTDLQDISRGIHPAILSKGGLAPAIKMLARRSAVPVDLDLRVDRRLPDRIEVAAYYVVSEALTNTAKHARASGVRVEVKADDEVMEISIRDDGVGGADPTAGSGLMGLRDRVETLGGKVRISSAARVGTSLLVTIPISAS
jgi:signal transduction histidine kinase